ncbi:MAG: DUF1788 domain-containing protein [Candidatus Obscuribacterales bacterium]|nr:DUF1788 domain-containing protein [Candidatus Obscuribacterales bacterium]
MSLIEKSSISKRFEHLLKVISSERFRNKEGLGNEVPFFICHYRADESIDFGRMQKQLTNKLRQSGISILEIDLYDTVIEILQNRGVWEQILEIEKTISKEELKELLQGVLDSEKHLIPRISEYMAKSAFEVMFITGVGEVFPYIRSHNVLNNLQSTAKEKPTVMFFPGAYTHSAERGASLDLFGRLTDDKYYRAFNIFHCEV